MGISLSERQSLKSWNSFGIQASARNVILLDRLDSFFDQREALQTSPLMILGGGSNILFTKDFPGTVLINELKGKTILSTANTEEVIVEVGAGENWHAFVQWCLFHDFGGLENLSLIPGKVGAAPIQNIGAYGVEIKDHFSYLQAIELSSGKSYQFNAADCAFGYRDSRFKREWKGLFLITKVAFRLRRKQHVLNTSYGAIAKVLAEKGIRNATIRDIADVVIAIRQSKLPDPAELGNAGSFFKNPEVEPSLFQNLIAAYPKMPHYPLDSGKVKIPAGWLIDQCGWKGKRVGDTGCYAKQALVIVNYGDASGAEIWEHALNVQASVVERFGIELSPEVNVI